ncbi:MAG TPA: aminopeptidase P N-terminal domain-containing protein [Cytophagales bacterium]|nr:aminopeptidase P N-terminal domain-containing protein [Cytophagales bacterium]
MRYTPITNQEYIDNRLKFIQQMQPKSLAVFNSNDVQPTNADGHLKFRQNNDLFYLTGIDQEETILVLFPEATNPKHREILFLRKTSELIAIWEGHKFTKEEGTTLSGITTVYWTEQFESVFNVLVTEADYIYLNSNEHARSSNQVQTRDERFVIWCKEKYPLHTLKRAAPIMQELRMIKSELEITQLKKAGSITEQAYARVLKKVKAGVLEYEIEAEITHQFFRSGSRGHAYEPIIASGASACVLHYIDNDKICKDGDLLLMDFGAEYGNYNADLTRTIPVNGRFTERQKAVYNAVLEVYKVAKDNLVAGTSFESYEQKVVKVMQEQLIKLGLFSKEDVENQDPEQPLYKKYFMHGVSHFLGLDVHDVGHKRYGIRSGMVLTIEPGIYIREEGLGVRIENNIWVKENGNEELMPNVATTVEEIEAAMSLG